jgi:hypothetical protein
MPIPFGWDGNETSTVDYNPFAPKYQDPPTPPIYGGRAGSKNYGGNRRIRTRVFQGFGDAKAWMRYSEWKKNRRDNPPPEEEFEETSMVGDVVRQELDLTKIGYETDWNYPNWLIRMAQWRNF